LRLLAYRMGGAVRLGVLCKDFIADVEGLLEDYLGSRGLWAPRPTLSPWGFYRLWGSSSRLLAEALEDCDESYRVPGLDLDSSPLEPPVPGPSKIVGIGLNYLDHAHEVGARPPREPIPFLKAPSSLVGHNHYIILPPGLEKVDYELELVVVIGRKASYASRAEALESIAGFTIGNDVSARDVQVDKRRPWSWAKSYDTFSPLGPVVVTCDEVDCEDPRLDMELSLNGRVMQKSNTSNMIFKPYELVMYVSRIMTLYPGDLIFTGTPAGVGFTRSPPVYLRDGDLLELEIKGIGLLRNRVKARGREGARVAPGP
jgi:2-keto-4-pentenoate hydratase/2-oxohepta-3-ene-1,7-dioic acid hydratase in catechol pathway